MSALTRYASSDLRYSVNLLCDTLAGYGVGCLASFTDAERSALACLAELERGEKIDGLLEDLVYAEGRGLHIRTGRTSIESSSGPGTVGTPATRSRPRSEGSGSRSSESIGSAHEEVAHRPDPRAAWALLSEDDFFTFPLHSVKPGLY